jgi:hypothetical protein
VFVVLPQRYSTCCCFYSKEHRDKWWMIRSTTVN